VTLKPRHVQRQRHAATGSVRSAVRAGPQSVTNERDLGGWDSLARRRRSDTLRPNRGHSWGTSTVFLGERHVIFPETYRDRRPRRPVRTWVHPFEIVVALKLGISKDTGFFSLIPKRLQLFNVSRAWPSALLFRCIRPQPHHGTQTARHRLILHPGVDEYGVGSSVCHLILPLQTVSTVGAAQ
jgi:hypothetical protein